MTAAALLACALVTACGGGDDDDPTDTPPPVPKPSQFPQAGDKTLAQLRTGLGRGGPVLAPSVSQLVAGQRNRFGFGLFTRERGQIADAQVAVYVAKAGGGEAQGPFVARWESLEVEPEYQSRQTAADPNAAKSVYVAELPLGEPGRYEVLGIAKLDERLVAATSASPAIPVLSRSEDQIPRPGEAAPRIHTPTEADAGGDLSSIDTRLPPSDMHANDFADVLGKKPIVLLFATPQLCQSRVCGPVVDIAEQVRSDDYDGVEFIHMEVFNDNQVEKGIRPQLVAYGLQSEPWLFTVDRKGRVAARLEGAFSEREMRAAIEKATGG